MTVPPEIKNRNGQSYLYSRKRIGSTLPSRVVENLDFARANLKANIYDQAIMEGVATSFPQTEEIIENGNINGMSASDVQKILNLKHAWEFILDRDLIQVESDYYILCHIARLINEGFFSDGGRIRGVPVRIGGSSYIPPFRSRPISRIGSFQSLIPDNVT